ncbi:response regulator transcription factor [Nocardia thraciensis]
MADANRPAVVRVLVYSSDSDTRRQVMLALGKHPRPDLPPFEYVEVATAPIVIEKLDAGGLDLAILDGEAAPTGGLGVAKQLKDELESSPPILVLTGRADDAWLANWSRAEASVPHPIDPFHLTDAVATLLRDRSAA